MNRIYKGRREDERLVTGRGRYTTDWSLPGQAHACFVRADRAHARILGIDASGATTRPDVLMVLTAADIEAAGYQPFHPNMRPVGVDGKPMAVPPRPVLAADKVRFVGEAVALVIAETRNGAIDAAELVMIDYEDLPPVVRPQDALADGAPQVHDIEQGNLGLKFQYGDKAAVEDAFARAAHIAEVTVSAERIVGNPMEPRSCLASYEVATGAYDVYVSNQGIAPMRMGLTAVTGLPPQVVRVQPIDVGGAFGIRSEAYPEYAALMLATRELGRPVKWTGTRAETIATDHQGRGSHMTSRLALDESGRFIGLHIDYLTDVGAWWSGAGPMVNSMAPMGQAVNVYDIPAVYGLHTLAYTTAVPTCAYRGASRPNCSYLMERLVDEAAKVSGIDRVTLRQRNFIPKEAFPYRTATGSVYDSGDPAGLLEDVLKQADWDGFEARRQQAAARGKLRGIGCAVFISPSGSPGKEQGIVSFGPEGQVVLLSLAGPSGQGHETAYPEVVADILGMEPEAVTLKYGDPDGPPLIGSGSFGSRSMISMGAALATAAHAVVRKGGVMAAEAFGAPVEDIDFEQGLYRRRGANESVSLQELIDRHAGEPEHPLQTLGDLDTAAAWPSGAHVAEVEIDPDTGVLQIMSYVAVDDCGQIMNHTLVEGQMHGGVMQGVGQVIGEQCVYDAETGQLLTGSFMDYFMPHAHDMPPLSLHDRPILAPGNLLGAKGAGEAGTTGAIPTIANAVIDALRPAGVEAIDMPYTPNRVWTALAAARG